MKFTPWSLHLRDASSDQSTHNDYFSQLVSYIGKFAQMQVWEKRNCPNLKELKKV